VIPLCACRIRKQMTPSVFRHGCFAFDGYFCSVCQSALFTSALQRFGFQFTRFFCATTQIITRNECDGEV
jgi:hypothetical protein